MPPLYPPEYPYRPDAPLLSFGPAFSEEIARSVVRAIWLENREQPHETDVRCASGLTMLEAFHPRDQYECMLAAQGVATHCAIMENFRFAIHPDTPPLLAIKYRANSVQLSRMFSLISRDLEHRQARPLPERPQGPSGSPPPAGPPDIGPMPASASATTNEAASEASPRPKRSRARTPPIAPAAAPQQPAHPIDPVPPEISEDLETRPDGTPGNLTAYAPEVPVAHFIPREAPIMAALATRPKPWRIVNTPKDPSSEAGPPAASGEATETSARRGPLDPRERMFTGDALARFAGTRFDPDAPIEPLVFEDEDSVVELELISTGGDPEAEAERAAMIAAHPEGKPIVTFRHGTKSPPAEPPGTPLPNGHDKKLPDI
jgi:hypothetical protein